MLKEQSKCPENEKCMLLPLMKHLSANVDTDTCREAAQIPFAFFEHTSQKTA